MLFCCGTVYCTVPSLLEFPAEWEWDVDVGRTLIALPPCLLHFPLHALGRPSLTSGWKGRHFLTLEIVSDCHKGEKTRSGFILLFFLTRLWAPERGSTYCQGDLFDVVWWIQWRLEWPHTEWREETTNRRAWSKGWGEKRRTLRFRSISVQEG